MVTNLPEIVSKLQLLGVPIHPLRAFDKVPVLDGWNINPDLVQEFDQGNNIGLRMGATIRMKKCPGDLYVFGLDIDIINLDIMKSVLRLFSDSKYIIERTGGQHQGRHIYGLSHYPLPSGKIDGYDIYCTNADFSFKNFVITPSVVKSEYKIFSNGHYTNDIDTIVKSWTTIINNPVSDQTWLKMMEMLVPAKELNKKLFIYSCIPLIVSDDFNYNFFGSIVSGMAYRLGFDLKTLSEWTIELLNLLPTGLKDNTTIKKIADFQQDTPNCKKFLPGFLRFEEVLSAHICKQREYTDTSKAVPSVIFYKDLFERLFETKPVKLDISEDYIESFFKLDNIKSEDKIDFCEEEDILSAGSVSMIYGEESSVKSWSMLDLTCAATTGGAFWGDRYHFKEPENVLYVYGDRSRRNHSDKYLKRYDRKPDNTKLKFIYVQNFGSNMRQLGREDDLDFDLAVATSMEFLDRSIKSLKSKIIIIDTIASCVVSGDMNDQKFVKPFMKRLRNIAITNECTIIIVHHSNKLTTKETRGKPLSRDDFMGSRFWSALSDWTLSIWINRDKPYEGYARIGKIGVLSTFENYDYRITNKKWEDAEGFHHIVHVDFIEPEENTPINNIQTEEIKYKILKTIGDKIMPAKALRDKFVRTDEVSSSRYQRFIFKLVEEMYIIKEGLTRNATYKLTPNALEFLKKLKEMPETNVA